MKVTRGFYRCVFPLAEPLAALYLLKRSLKQKDYLKGWGERFGFAGAPVFKEAGRTIWVHAVSVGETNAALPLIKALLNGYPDVNILLTHMTPTGRDAGEKIAALSPGRVLQMYLPYDSASNAAHFFDTVKPVLGIVMETEVWPNILHEAKRRGIPTVLANGRLSEKSLRAALRFMPLMGGAYADFTVICAQDASDAKRYLKLQDKPPVVTGSVKFDAALDAAQCEAAKRDKSGFTRKVVCLASSREGEEALFIDAVRKNKRRDILYMIVVRHPQRFAAVEKLLTDAFIPYEKKSQTPFAEVSEKTALYLGDTMGEMAYFMTIADVVIMGGSFCGTGCQNVIEPALASCPVIVGPSTFNFAYVIEKGEEAGAILPAKDMQEALNLALDTASDPQKTKALGEKAFCYAQSLKGATRKTLEVIGRYLKK